MSTNYHTSVLLHESIDALNIFPEGKYVDMTFGGGGHSRAILSRLSDRGQLYAFDQDIHAWQNQIDDSRLTLIHQNFANSYEYLVALGVESVDGVLADLGVSSFQFDMDDSGFSYRENIALDMRMDPSTEIKASDILMSYSVDQLQHIFQIYGEVRNAKTLAQRIVETRAHTKIERSNDLNTILQSIKFGTFESYAAPVYQALRMEVNQEIKVLEDMLQGIQHLIKPGGRMAVITFHSLEDKVVKNFMKYGEFIDEPTTDIFGRRKPWNWNIVTRKPIVPSADEIRRNPRSRSSKLRVVEKIKTE